MKDLPEKLSPLLGDASEHQEDIERINGVKMPTVHLYEGYSRGPRATKDRCTICHRLIGHHCFVVVDGEGLANATCYAQREAERRVEKRDIAADRKRLKGSILGPLTLTDMVKHYISRTEAAEKRVAELEGERDEALAACAELRGVVSSAGKDLLERLEKAESIIKRTAQHRHRLIRNAACKQCKEFPCEGDDRVLCIHKNLMTDIDAYLKGGGEDA